MEDIKKVEATIFLDYLFKNIKPYFSKILIDKKEYLLEEVDKKEIKIKFNDIEEELGYKTIKIGFINEDNTKEMSECDIIPGINNGILLPLQGTLRDIILPENNKKYKINIKHNGDKKEFEIKNNRLLLINLTHSFDLFIDEILITSEILNLSGNSVQVYCPDLGNRLFFAKDISPVDCDGFLEMYDNYNYEAKAFYNKINNMLGPKLFSYDLYKTYFNREELEDILFTKLNFPKKILKNKYNEKKYFEFISYCSLYCILPRDNEEKEIKNIFDYFKAFKEQLEKDSDLEYYMKNMIMLEFSSIMLLKDNLDKFKSINFTYYNMKNVSKNSPLDISNQFLKIFIDKLDDKSPFFYPLSLIDSGIFSYKKDSVYGLGLINTDILKSHLRNILPDLVIVINDEEEKVKQGITNKALGTVVINIASPFLSPLKNVKIDQELKDQPQDFSDKLALILFIEFFHEIFGHKKGGYSQKTNHLLSSPNVFYDKQKKKILKLVDRNSPVVFKDEINILRDCEHDAGYFLEYFIGECEYGFYSELIEIMIEDNVNLNLIFNNELWNEKIEIMRKYIKLKYIIFRHNKDLLDKIKYNNINEEISDLEKIIKEKNIKLDIVQESQIVNKKDKLISSNRKDLNSPDKKKQYIIAKYEKMSFYEIKKIMDTEEIPHDIRLIFLEILLNKIRRK